VDSIARLLFLRGGQGLLGLCLGAFVGCSTQETPGGDAGGSAGSPAGGGAGASSGGVSGTSSGTGGQSGTGARGGASGAGAAAGSEVGGAGGSGAATGGASGSENGGSAGRSGAGGASGGSGGAAGADAGAGGAGAGAGGMAGSASGGKAGAGGSAPTISETVDIEDVFSGHPVNFALVTRENRQFAAYYDTNRNMTVASRTLGSTTWTFKRLASVLGWDSHNHVAMALDVANQIHVSGNMHNVPLVYFRSSSAYDAMSLAASSMVGTNEQSVTYPEFFTGPSQSLVFIYRDGGSGNGNHVFNRFASGTWTRLLGTPLTDGQGARNAYPVGPIQGPDGAFHLVWVWRDSPDAATNHDISYIRSTNLTSWVAGNGSAVTLPITLSTPNVIVDPVPVSMGMINNNTKVGFDAQGRPIVGYHKFESASGPTQLYNARFENGQWVVHKTTDWTYRWNFGGQGTLVFAIELDGVRVRADGALVQDFYHSELGGRGTLRLDPTTLHVVETLPPDTPYPRSLDTPQSSTAGMIVRWAKDGGSGPDASVKYMLRWETLPSNQDMPRPTIPPPTRLRVYGFR
jgi:hypothetical protein